MTAPVAAPLPTGPAPGSNGDPDGHETLILELAARLRASPRRAQLLAELQDRWPELFAVEPEPACMPAIGGAALPADSTGDHSGVRLELAQPYDQIANLKQALASSRDIGAAIGVLMATHRLSRQQAFDRLVLISQRRHRKVRELARDVLLSGELFAIPPHRDSPSSNNRPAASR